MAKKYAPKLPLQLDSDGNFINIQDISENIKQNLRMIILTNPGEKIMDPDFGVGVKKYLFENEFVYNRTGNANSRSYSIEDIKQTVARRINNQILKYGSDIKVIKNTVEFKENILFISIQFSYKGYSDVFSINIQF